MTACKDLELLLSLHAAGALDPAEAARVEAHLASCAACRSELAAGRDALSLAKLPPVSEAERRAVAAVPARALAALRAGRRLPAWKPLAAAVALAAALLAAVLAPALLRRPPEVPAQATATWEVPDLDSVWEDTAILDLEGATASSSGESEAALAALDF